MTSLLFVVGLVNLRLHIWHKRERKDITRKRKFQKSLSMTHLIEHLKMAHFIGNVQLLALAYMAIRLHKMKNINLWNLTGAILLILGLSLSFYSLSQIDERVQEQSALQKDSDYYDHYLSENISAERLAELEREAKEEWIIEYGENQVTLTEEAERYLIKQTMIIQEFYDAKKEKLHNEN